MKKFKEITETYEVLSDDTKERNMTGLDMQARSGNFDGFEGLSFSGLVTPVRRL